MDEARGPRPPIRPLDTRLDRIHAERAAVRARDARRRILALLDDLADAPVEVGVIGSLARDDFRVHSDVDLLVLGPIDPPTRLRVERAVAAAMRGSGLAYDVVYAHDLTPERLEEFRDGYLSPSRIREAWAEAGTGGAGAGEPA